MDNVKRFVQQYGSLAAQVGEKVGVAPEVLLGQWGLETGWGKSVVPGTNNLGNIKDFSGAGPKATDNMTGSRDAYRAYSTPQDFGSDYADLISRRYKGATGAGTDAMKYGTALKSAGYAEDPNYASKLAGATNLVRKFADMALSSVSGTANAATSGVSDKVKQARDAGYSDDEIFQHLSQSQSFADKVKQAKDAGYSDADIRQHFGLGGKTEAAKPEAKAEPRKEEPGALTNFAKGVAQGIKADIIGGPAQLLRNIVPESVGRAVDSFGNKLADLGLPIARVNGAEDLNRQIQEQEAQYQRDTDGSIAAGTGRVAANIAGALGAGGGSVVSGGGRGGQAAVRMLGGGNTAQAAGRLAGQSAGSAVLGAGTGALAPVTQEGDYGQNKLTQIATGAAIGGALPGATAAVTGAGRYTGNALRSLIDPFTEAGQTRIAGNVLNRFAEGGPIAGDVAERVVGSTPTLAQATGNPGLATLERGIQSSTPQGANAFAERAAQAAAARTGAMERASGTASDIATAEAARGSRASQQLSEAFREAKPADPNATLGVIDSILTGPSGKRDAVRSALSNIRSKLVDADGKLETNAETLYNSVRKQIGDLLDGRMAASNPAGLQASRELIAVRDALDQDIASAAPGFGQYLADYASASRPINAMEFLQGLKLTDAQGNITLARVQNAISNIAKQRSASGANGAKAVSQAQMDALTAIREDLLRAANSGAGKSIGSNTFQNLATNNIVENALPGPVRALMGGTNGPVGTAAGKVGNLIYGGANEAIQNRLLELMMNPQSGVAALQNVRSNQLTGPLGGNALLQRLAPNLLPAGTVGANVIARPNSQ
ncbi:glucosaminidase domain-containing protein [Cupriavidus campinensis]